MPDTAPPPSLAALENRLAEAHHEVRALTGELRSAYQRLERLQCHLRRSISEIERLEARGPAHLSGVATAAPEPPGASSAGSREVIRVSRLPDGNFGVYHHGALHCAFANFCDALEEARRIALAEDLGEPPAGTVTVVDGHVSPEEARRIAWDKNRAEEMRAQGLRDYRVAGAFADLRPSRPGPK